MKAVFKHIRISPRKLRLVVDSVRGLDVDKAIDQLLFVRKPIAQNVSKLIKSAVSNASKKEGVRTDRLYVKKITVDPGPTLHRIMPRARGSATSIQKRVSHLSVELGERI